MRIALAAVVMLVGLLGNVADAGFVYFRGNINTILNDSLGLAALPDQRFEALVEVDEGTNAIVNTSYMVFLGKDFKLNSGTFSTGANVNFGTAGSQMAMFGPNTNFATATGASARFIFNQTVPAVANGSSAELAKLIGLNGSVLINDGTGLAYIGTITAVPEPTSMALVGLAAVGAGAYRRFRRKPAAK